MMAPSRAQEAIMSKTNPDAINSENWRRHWEGWKESGLSQAEYGRRHGLKIHIFRYWVTKFNQPETLPVTTALVKLPIQAQTTRDASLELVVDKKYRLIIRTDFDSDLLQAVLSSLEGRSCS
jgi:hypothetical protein